MALIRKYGFWMFAAVSAPLYLLFAQDLHRSEHLELLLTFATLVALWLLMHRFIPKKWGWLFGIGLAFRLCFLFATPHLSDDYFRFMWDGELNKDGYEVFGFIPSQFNEHVSDEHAEKYQKMLKDSTAEFPSGMNSKNYYSIYPSVNQFVFQTSALGGDPKTTNLDILRLWILIAEIATFFLLKALLTAKNQSGWLSIYWLHPLIIIELSGNLHLEALAITFIVLALYLAHINHWIGAALAVALGVMTKLTPLLILGAFFKQLDWKRWIVQCTVAGIASIGLFAIYVNLETFANFKSSVGLFFAWFSFNAGIYYSIKELVLLISGADISAWISLFFPFISAGIMIWITFFKKADVATTALLLFTTYFLFTPILHPWYVTVLIPLAILSGKVYPLVWSVLIFGTYLAYGDSFKEPLWWIVIEFGTVIAFLFAEFKKTPNWSHKIADRIYH
ncbi:hypothetical protein OAK35_00690 [Crocinitomicaceae bacterium]|nr:hypothetical protein [Crocinitomicaceae bacterium]MDC0257237.1 hypothetical protein [Crocinitomicaceae bacterium]